MRRDYIRPYDFLVAFRSNSNPSVSLRRKRFIHGSTGMDQWGLESNRSTAVKSAGIKVLLDFGHPGKVFGFCYKKQRIQCFECGGNIGD